MIRWIGPDPLPPRDFGRLNSGDRWSAMQGPARHDASGNRFPGAATPDPMVEIGRFVAIVGGGLTGAAGVYGVVYATVWSMMNALGA